VTVVVVQIFGVLAIGPGYFEKFFQFRRLVNGGPFGIIDFGVGFLEIILEFAKITPSPFGCLKYLCRRVVAFHLSAH